MAASSIGLDLCKSWDKTGKSQVLKLYKELSSGMNDFDSVSMYRFLFELLHHVIKGTLKSTQALGALEHIMEQQPALCQDIVAVLCILDADTGNSGDSIARKNLMLLLKDIQSLIPICVLKEQLNPDTLEELGLIDAQQFNQKYIRMKTKIFYKQQKFNLLREETEGYAKLITEISQDLSSSPPVSTILDNIKALIGCFNLDPNRVLDIILEVFENRIELADDLFVPLLSQYIPEYDTICQMLGFRLQSYQPSQLAEGDSKSVAHTPPALFAVIAALMRHGLVSLDSIYPHLGPSDASIQVAYKKMLTESRSTVKKTRAVQTAGEKKEDAINSEQEGSGDSKVEPHNQKLGLAEALLKQGAWRQAKEVMDRLPQYYAASHLPIAMLMCELVHYTIDPLYSKHHGLPNELRSGASRTAPTNLYLSQASEWSQLLDSAFPMLRYLGCHVTCDTILIVKVIRILRAFISLRNTHQYTEPDSDLLFRNCLAVLDEVMLPSLCLAEANCCLAEQMWTVLQLLPYTLRYQLYGQWKNETYYSQPELIAARFETTRRAKYIFSRLTKDNVKQQGRQIGKLSHANPAVFFEYMLTQVQVYDNLIGPIVDALKYLSSLSYDVLAYCMIEALSAPDKERMKYDDTNLSNWLKSLANFTGAVLKKYNVEFAGLLQYICNQLKAEKSFDLLILREILTKMGGIEVSEEVTEQQLEAMCGGELLRAEGGNFLQMKNVKKPSQRLKDVLLKYNLATPLCLLMAQQRDCIIYKETVQLEHIKLIGKVYDQCQDTLVQFISFLSSQLTVDEFARKLPSLESMLSDYHIPSDAAFYLMRPMLSHSINSKFETLRRQDRQARERDKTTTLPEKTQRFIEAVTSVIEPASENIKPLFEPKMWEELSPVLYTTFWALHIYDLHVPKEAYERELNQVKQRIQAIQNEAGRDLNTKRKKEIERYNQVIAKLKDEEKKQTEHCVRVLSWLEHDKHKWFKSYDTQKNSKGKNEAVGQFIQFCIFPRVLNTSIDAIYCSKIIHTMHKIKTPNFGTLICLDRLFNDITYLITCCTENEAHRYGRFLSSILEMIMRWHSSKTIFEEECSGHPGFITIFRAGTLGTNHAELSYEDYRHVCHKWQFRITKAAISCFESGNYTQIRNALIVLTKILPYYPLMTGIGQALERRVDRVHKEEREKRPDLYALAMGYTGMLKAKKSAWIPESQFHHVDPEKMKKKQEEAKAKQAAAVKQSDTKGDAAKAELTKTEPPSIKPTSKTDSVKATMSKERLEAAAFLKMAEATNKAKTDVAGPDIIEVKVRRELKESVKPSSKVKEAAVANGSSDTKDQKQLRETLGQVKSESSRLSDVKREKPESENLIQPSVVISPARSSSAERDAKKRKVETPKESNIPARDVSTSIKAPSLDSKRAVIKSPAANDPLKDKNADKDPSKDLRKRSSDLASAREELTKKRRSDLDQKPERHKNGDLDKSHERERSPKQRAKEETRDKDRKSDKHRSRKSE